VAESLAFIRRIHNGYFDLQLGISGKSGSGVRGFTVASSIARSKQAM
jgi:hypothetical protein